MKELTFLYRNWRGETALRIVVPKGLVFGSTSYHPKEQWFLVAFDVEKQQERQFALADILTMEDGRIFV